MKKIAVILNGAGHRDGSEIHEAVLTLLAIEEAGGRWEALALDRAQSKVFNHIDGAEDLDASPRNMLKESARIARGRIQDLSKASVADYDAVLIPGGSGTASNLCDFAKRGAAMTVLPAIVNFLELAHQKGKPIGALCISPIILARVFGSKSVRLTLGSVNCDAAIAAKEMGAEAFDCSAKDCVVDETLKIVTTPAYMQNASMLEIYAGIRMLIKEVFRLV